MRGCKGALGCVAAFGFTVLTASCSSRGLISRLVPADTDQFAREFIDTLESRPARDAMSFFIPHLAMNDAVSDTLAVLQGLLPRGLPDSIELASVAVRSEAESTQRILEYQVHAQGKWALVRLTIDESDDTVPRVAGLHVWPLPASLESINALTLQNASPGGLIAVTVALGLLAFPLYVAIQVVRSPLKQRWLWAIVAFLGFGRIGVAWKSGAVTHQWLAVQLFDAGIQRQAILGPWWVFLAFPGGALVALERRRRAIVDRARQANIVSPAPPAVPAPNSSP